MAAVEHMPMPESESALSSRFRGEAGADRCAGAAVSAGETPLRPADLPQRRRTAHAGIEAG